MSLSIFHAKNNFMRVASEDEIMKIMSMGVDKADRAIVTLILSSGLPSKFIEEMTYEQLLDACKDYFRYDELRTIPNLVGKNPLNENIIACFDIGNKTKPRMTCCSPESLQLIIEYLRYRKNVEIDSDEDYVFLNSNFNQIAGKNHIDSMFRRARKKADNYLPDNESLNTTSGDVRNRFKQICNDHLEGQYRNEVLTLMEGSKSTNNKRFYEHVKDNRYLLINHYKTVVDYLTLSSSVKQDNPGLNNYTMNYK